MTAGHAVHMEQFSGSHRRDLKTSSRLNNSDAATRVGSAKYKLSRRRVVGGRSAVFSCFTRMARHGCSKFLCLQFLRSERRKVDFLRETTHIGVDNLNGLRVSRRRRQCADELRRIVLGKRLLLINFSDNRKIF